ncbi:50S ribosomal protein L25 [Candidatus Peregrinibacteria bacterium]|nr:50S ribosomal protein L25 [Candidatus Peregrinibacteria bacterium]
MEPITLKVTETSYATAKDARKANRIPVAYYAKGVKNRSFSVNYQEFRKAYDKGGRSTILSFVNEKEEALPVLVHDLQYDPITDLIIHADVMAVDMNKPIRAQVPVRMVGISPAVRDLGGVLVQNKKTIEVECLPKDLIREVTVDIGGLVDFHTSLKIKDVQFPSSVKVLDNLGISLATVSSPRPTEEEEAAKAAAAAAAPVPGAVPAEGAAAPAEGAEGAKKEGAAAAPAAKKEEKKK